MSGRLVSRNELSRQEEDSMFALLEVDFEGVSRSQFLADLDEKNWIVLLQDGRGDRIKGFSTLDIRCFPHEGSDITVVYSGDTVVSHQDQGSTALARVWIGGVSRLRRQHPSGPLYWFLISSGYRTYRYLPVYYRRFYPRFDEPTPPPIQSLMDALARDRFGNRYFPEQGVVRLKRPQILREHLRGIPEKRLRDSHVEFFAARNPGHEQGDELVCLTEISPENLTPAGRRMWSLGEASLLATEVV